MPRQLISAHNFSQRTPEEAAQRCCLRICRLHFAEMKRLPVFAWLRAWYVALKDGEAIAGRLAGEARSSRTRTGGIHTRSIPSHLRPAG
jgi:hypothetical protein